MQLSPNVAHSSLMALDLPGVSDSRQHGHTHIETTPLTSIHIPLVKNSSQSISTKTNNNAMTSLEIFHSHLNMKSSEITLQSPTGSNIELLKSGSDDFRENMGVFEKRSGAFQSDEEMYNVPLSFSIENMSPMKVAPPHSTSSVARHKQLAKYSAHHLHDPFSKCASRMVSVQTIQGNSITI